jgi:hypothetical protein
MGDYPTGPAHADDYLESNIPSPVEKRMLV